MATTDVAGGDRKVATAAAFLEAAGGRPCDGCHTALAVLHCPADAAFICGPCDARVHGANGLASRHERAWLCEVCEHAPAVVTCKADAAALCASCDADIHSVNPLARRHERVPLLPFSGPSPRHPHANFFAPVAGACHERDDKEEEEAESGVKTTEVHSWLLPTEDTLEPLAATKTNFYYSGDHSFLDLAFVPQMEDIKKVVAPDNFFDLDISGRKADAEHSYCHSISSSEAAVVPDITQKVATRRPVEAAPATTTTRMDRKAKVMKYREKRKNRRFEKTIRYASRKAYAEVRPRIKGRFAKRTEVESEVEVEEGRMCSSAVAAFLEDNDFCVPSFYP